MFSYNVPELPSASAPNFQENIYQKLFERGQHTECRSQTIPLCLLLNNFEYLYFNHAISIPLEYLQVISGLGCQVRAPPFH